MARLEVEIGGSVAGLGKAGNEALGILERLQIASDSLKIDLFKAQDVTSLNAVGNALAAVTGEIKAYTTEAIKGSLAFQTQQTNSALDTLGTKLSVLTGNAMLFGDSLKNQQDTVNAYQAALNKLLAAGLSPVDAEVVALKNQIDSLNASLSNSKGYDRINTIFANLSNSLSVAQASAQVFGNSIKNQQSQLNAYQTAITALLRQGVDPLDSRIVTLKSSFDNLSKSIEQASANDPFASFKSTGGLIAQVEQKLSNLRIALSQATDEGSIAKYNKRLIQAQDELTRLNKIGLSASDAARKLSGGYNAVGLELGRVIQDAPFAANNFGAIGNNITRLVEVMPQYVAQSKAAIEAQGGVATSGAVAKQSLLGLFTGFGAVTLGISALVAGYTIYQQHQQAVKREQDKLTGATGSYIDSLHGIARAQLEGTKNAQGDLTNLRLLYKVYQDANVPLKERKIAYQQLQEMFPAYFKNIAFEETASGRTKKAYDELTGSIMATARARAAANVITRNSERAFDNESKATRLQIELQKALAKEKEANIQKSTPSMMPGESGDVTNSLATVIEGNKATNERIAIQQKLNNILTDTKRLNEQNVAVEKKARAEMAKGGTLRDLTIPTPKKGKKAPVDRSDDIVRTSDKSADLFGLEGADKQVEELRQKYIKLYADLAENAKKSAAGQKTYSQDLARLQANEAYEASGIITAEAARVASEVERIRAESGIKAAESRDKELAQIDKWYTDQVVKANGNAVILASIEEGKQAQIQAVRDKYEAKRLAAEDAINTKIADISDKAFRVNENNTVKGSKVIDAELDKRIKAVQDYFDKLRKMYMNDPMAQLALGAAQGAIVQKMTNNADTAKDGGLGKELSRAVSRFGSDMFKTLSTIHDRADQSFLSIVGDLAKNLTDALNNVFLNVFEKKLTAILDKAMENMSEQEQALAGGAMLLGSIISGATKKTSSLGQGAGGALKGAGTGAVIGSAIPGVGTAAGAIVGGIVGAIGGLFGAGKARKQEELAKKQLEEEKKQTALLERQNALAYTASIIGRMTTNGVVSGIEVNEFGQLTTKIAGQDLQILLDRANNARKRGV